jgi:hypothetical protein
MRRLPRLCGSALRRWAMCGGGAVWRSLRRGPVCRGAVQMRRRGSRLRPMRLLLHGLLGPLLEVDLRRMGLCLLTTADRPPQR